MPELPIFIVSGGKGSSGTHLVNTALAQFKANDAALHIVADVERAAQIVDIVRQAAQAGGIIVHTLVDAALRDVLTETARAHNVTAIDLIGPLLMVLTRVFQREPLGQPGLYRQLRDSYFRRMEAIEFAVSHDDGRKPHELDQAEIILTGVSRSGKTPLSMYLSTQGWKTANVPLVPEMTPPETLFEVDARRVVGLYIDPANLVSYRRRRQASLGLQPESVYTDPTSIQAEIEFARSVFRRGHFTVIDVTNRPIEESADEVIARVTRNLRE